MTTAVHTDSAHDLTDVPRIVRYSIQLGVIQTVAVLLVSLTNRFLEGTADAAVTGVIVAIGAVATIFLPGIWTRARSIEGIAGAAGIGLGAALAFLVLDVVLLQPLGTWTNRWYEVGGHSNWWYHPVWWMVGSYLSWLGAYILSNQAARRGEPSLGGAIGLVAVLTVILGAAAAVLHFPGAGWNVPTFAVAVMPALALGTVVSGLGGARN
ncbi:MAG: hypothetical protein KC485_01275 [Gemmatimonadetes bacterium]|nr:hypothetical protein [Gemmatimonadota bacterium]MCB9518270.1 hypothetical protein [Gemmatimonadales bacterium]